MAMQCIIWKSTTMISIIIIMIAVIIYYIHPQSKNHRQTLYVYLFFYVARRTHTMTMVNKRKKSVSNPPFSDCPNIYSCNGYLYYARFLECSGQPCTYTYYLHIVTSALGRSTMVEYSRMPFCLHFGAQIYISLLSLSVLFIYSRKWNTTTWIHPPSMVQLRSMCTLHMDVYMCVSMMPCEGSVRTSQGLNFIYALYGK